MAGQNPGSPTDFQYFYEDEVYKINNHGQVVFGLVLENYEANSSDQESDIETPIQKGEIRVVWHPSGTERVISEKSVGLADRSLMPGDVVRRLIAGKDTQRGYCRDIVMTAALQIVGTKHVIPSVASERLQPLEEFTPDLAVCLDSWVGTSKAVNGKLRLVSADGSRLEYPDLDNCPLEDYSMRRRRSTPYSSSEFYPGQIVYGPLGALDSANWLNMTKEMKAARKHKMHEHKFTVEAVVTESVGVHWQCRALSTHPAEAAPQQPKYLVEGEDLKNLKLLNVFEPCTLQVGDRNFLTIGAEDTFVSKQHWRKQQSKFYRSIRKQTRPTKKQNSEHVPSRPKKRASAHRKLKSVDNEMEVDPVESTLESLDEALKADSNCPSIKIEPSADISLPNVSSQEDTATEEKNDSGVSGLSKSHIHSPEPNKDSSELLNGDSKSELTLNDDDSENWENTSSDGSDTDSGATWSSRCSSATSTRGKRSPQLAVRLLRGKRLKRTVRRAPPAPPPRLGERVVVETLHTTSRANVVWQDGTIEVGIPSTQLYPIHHLDGQECFPGDFVVSGAASLEENQQLKHREYGVVQRVDHHGRTAIVHWYRTYTSADEPVPQMLNESEMSVYDLKDHPDFQYRPGTVVIRVANFTGEDATCTAGQVIDNFPSGRVKVWWVDGHMSMCWPQDLYKVGEYDSEEGELWGSDGSGSEDSWETQSSAHDAEPRTPLAPAPDSEYQSDYITYSEEGELWGSDGSGSEDSWETQSSAHDAEPRTPLAPAPDSEYQSDYITYSEEGELWGSDGSGSEDSWETQSSAHDAEPRTPLAPAPDSEYQSDYITYSEEGELWGSDGSGSEDSWETQSSAHDAEPRTPLAPAPDSEYQSDYITYSEEGELWGSDGSGSEDSWETQSSAHDAEPRTPLAPAPDSEYQSDYITYSEEGELWGSDGSGSEDSWETQSSAHDAEPRTPLAPAPDSEYQSDYITYSEEGELWGSDGSGSEDSWETQSSAHDAEPRTSLAPAPDMRRDMFENVAAIKLGETTAPAPAVPRLLEPRVAAHIERGRVAMRRLEEMFAKHPTLQSQEIMRKLLNLYKDCRFLDRLMGTSFFHEDHFLGLLERVRERGASTPRAGERRVHEQLARLFAPGAADDEPPPAPAPAPERPPRAIITANVCVEPMEVENTTPKKQPDLTALDTVSLQPSGSDAGADTDEVTIIADNPGSEPADADGAARNVCYKLCSLIHSQLVKAHKEVSRRRPQELAEFLNGLMEKQNVTEEKLPYHFTVQYGALVVSMADQEAVGESEPGQPTDAEVAPAAATEGIPAPTETAPLATAEPVDVEPPGSTEAENGGEGFCLLEAAPTHHRFRLSMLQPSEPRSFYTAVKREIKLLKSDLPPGVWVRGFEDRIDLLSLMIAGPSNTPYEGGLFVFDVQLGGEYPRAPPLCHYHSYCTDRLNPNLYEDGKVCVSLLGTWSGRGVEVWGKDSSLLQVIVSLQGLILNSEPYFNEAGYEKQKGTQQGTENSRMYNEMVLLKLVQSMTKMLSNPPEPFRDEILQHLRTHAASLCHRLESWVELSNGASDIPPPDFPLVPASRGFCLTLKSSLESFRAGLRRHEIPLEL